MKSLRNMSLLTAVFLMAALPLTACGVAFDMAEDNEWRWGLFGKVEFVSPLKLKVGVAPFYDDVGMGTPEAGANMARLMSEELARDERLLVVGSAEVSSAMSALGYSLPLIPKEAAEIGRYLGLNALVVGSISEIKQYQVRKGWRRLARVLTSQHQYVDAVLAVSAVDSATGIVLVSRANTGEYDEGKGDGGYFETTAGPSAPTQEAMEASLDAALVESYHRTLMGLATLPFKTEVLSSAGTSVTIAAGEDVGLESGDEFVLLSVDSVITNTIGDTYHIMGAPQAHLVVDSVSENQAHLTVTDGHVETGDIIQTGESRGSGTTDALVKIGALAKKQAPAALSASAWANTKRGNTMYVQLTTTMGRIVVELDAEKAPKTVANFVQYVKEGHYDGTIFHRVIAGFMIQGGGMDADMNEKATREPIENEAKNGLKNDKYTIAMARTQDPHSATSQFFINTPAKDNDFLNFTAENMRGWGYAVFGRVVEGQDVVDTIEDVETSSKSYHDDVPNEPVIIEKAEVLENYSPAK